MSRRIKTRKGILCTIRLPRVIAPLQSHSGAMNPLIGVPLTFILQMPKRPQHIGYINFKLADLTSIKMLVANRVKHMRYPAEKTTKGWLYLICFVYTKKLCRYETLPTNLDSSDWRRVLGSMDKAIYLK